MAVDIIVKRGAGDSPAGDISSAMMVSKRVAITRGTFELDHDSTNRLQVAADLVDTGYVRRGLIVEVAEEEETWRGMTVGFKRVLELVGNGGSVEYAVNATLEIEREDRS